MLITQEEYDNLSPITKELHDYLLKWKPKKYNELAKENKLLPYLLDEGKKLDKLVEDQLDYLGIAGAKQLAREEIYEDLPEGTDDDPDGTAAHETALHEMWEIFRTEMAELRQRILAEKKEKRNAQRRKRYAERRQKNTGDI